MLTLYNTESDKLRDPVEVGLQILQFAILPICGEEDEDIPLENCISLPTL